MQRFEQRQLERKVGRVEFMQLLMKERGDGNIPYFCRTCGMEHHSMKEAAECCSDIE